VTALSREQVLVEMGLGPIWKLRVPAQSATPIALSDDPPMPFLGQRSDEWGQLSADVAVCQRCELCQQRKQAVLGVGDHTADWMFVGEGPGAEEDERGEPFVGMAGKLLDNMLAAIQLRRGDEVYIANAVKCRPPGNRTPSDIELSACRGYLEKQVDLIKPRIIVALGSSAAKTLLQMDQVKVGSLRGQVHEAMYTPLIVTYHPSYLLRSPLEKAKAWEDLCFMRRTMQKLTNRE
jgi:uracil-DNA glycosylase